MTALLLGAGLALLAIGGGIAIAIAELNRPLHDPQPPTSTEDDDRDPCTTRNCHLPADLPHPDGGAGGVCDTCWMELTR